MATETWGMAMAIARVCQIDTRTYTGRQKGQLLQAAKSLLGAEATIRDIVAFGEYWTTQDWRGKRGSPPSPSQIRQEWGRFQAAKEASVPALAYYS